jgi:hypothetical protein
VSHALENLKPFAVNFTRASELTSVSKSKLRQMAKTGELRTVCIGARRIVPITALQELCTFGSERSATELSAS